MIEENSSRQLADAIRRACTELPSSSAVEQLRNFCGRGWEMLHTPEFAALYRQLVEGVPRHPELGRFYTENIYGPMLRVLEGIIERGIAQSEFRLMNAGGAARVILAALVQQALWCNYPDGFGPTLGRNCNRIVADTLSIVLGGIARE